MIDDRDSPAPLDHQWIDRPKEQSSHRTISSEQRYRRAMSSKTRNKAARPGSQDDGGPKSKKTARLPDCQNCQSRGGVRGYEGPGFSSAGRPTFEVGSGGGERQSSHRVMKIVSSILSSWQAGQKDPIRQPCQVWQSSCRWRLLVIYVCVCARCLPCGVLLPTGSA